jgi:hypothetical protein
MPRLDEPVKISSRPPWLDPREPFWRHQFAGGNEFMLRLLRDHANPLELNAQSDHFEPIIARARQQLEDAATVTAQGWREGNTLIVRVIVENRTGHKFPTGHPYRRAWLRLRISDLAGRTLFESGAANAQGRLSGFPGHYRPHYDVITQPDQVQIYEAVMGDSGNQATRSLLKAATYLKDNRLPPHGFRPDRPEHAPASIRGNATRDANFNAYGNGRDEVTYRVTVNAEEPTVLAEVELLYQSVPPEAIPHLLMGRGPAAVAFQELYSDRSNLPVVVGRVRRRI